MIEFNCPHCAGHIQVKDESLAGHQTRCDHCSKTVTVPASESEEIDSEKRESFEANVERLLTEFAAYVERLLNDLNPGLVFLCFVAGIALLPMIWLLVHTHPRSQEFWVLVIAGLLILLVVQTQRILVELRRPERER